MSALLLINSLNLPSARQDLRFLLKTVLPTMGLNNAIVGWMNNFEQPPPANGSNIVVKRISTKEQLSQLGKDFIDSVNVSKRGLIAMSSHGYSGIPDRSGLEIDGQSEYIVLNGQRVMDYELREIFLNRVEDDVKLLILTDTCHSGTMWNMRCSPFGKNGCRCANIYQPGKILSISSCSDSQSSSDDLSHSSPGFHGGLFAALKDYLAKPNKQSSYEVISQRLSKLNQTLTITATRAKLLEEKCFLKWFRPTSTIQKIQKQTLSSNNETFFFLLFMGIVSLVVWLTIRQKNH